MVITYIYSQACVKCVTRTTDQIPIISYYGYDPRRGHHRTPRSEVHCRRWYAHDPPALNKVLYHFSGPKPPSGMGQSEADM